VKLDVEGAEGALLEDGASGWLDHVSVLSAELHPPAVPLAEAIAAVCAHGFVHVGPDVLGPRTTDLFFHPDRVHVAPSGRDAWDRALAVARA
jgi:hypothetical protein